MEIEYGNDDHSSLSRKFISYLTDGHFLSCICAYLLMSVFLSGCSMLFEHGQSFELGKYLYKRLLLSQLN